jgi:hypothetical protein
VTQPTAPQRALNIDDDDDDDDDNNNNNNNNNTARSERTEN